MFLVELMAAEHPDWSEELLYCLFGEDFSDAAPQPTAEVRADGSEPTDDEPSNRAILLARLAVDPHAGLGEQGLKWAAVTRCCAFEAAQQKRMEVEIRARILGPGIGHDPQIFRVLLGANRDELPQVWVMLTDALRDADVRALSLTGTPIDDLSPPAFISDLEALDLYGSNVSDLSPLSTLAALEMLNLGGARVTDVGPLAALTGLQSLNLMDHAGARRGAPGRPHRPQIA